ncbi:uncharacterized protein LOC129583884 [Paramacrobiotus metropolitanus]|uniref:uncharacterized protein LOC129583884 n=1 Tax=Paramacrobiotus metropolitanus TaxID=2943436 RepID=UPI0024460DED|nr:uncharacterized protein LOC129583884 [Paramacrobiotus metropolitanus]XP_055331878.1 uncharacterized protein LOC129583884 [Paramacrobiotus metropolitanus]XP_055331879.1 uncharacterized protein LOC129583884 [Paramacrobiotus metropolitanus]XP_055331880.1 uncharacterized protein LOC129583884 [Paramacrobiotus metropolitanus]XP_055331881.1 uncharacterized protein LOC129583884 [Paramacrobiotus metropolitanus]XP_055331882.1 uncharacterized protein LOC129583884 [Paramacrobiotus metropolitanus]
MDTRTYILERIPTLLCLSIVEIVFGILSVIGVITKLIRAESQIENQLDDFATGFLSAALLVATGVYGVVTIRRVRQGIVDAKSFRILGILNIVLCVIWAIEMLFFIVVYILTETNPSLANAVVAWPSTYDPSNAELQKEVEGLISLVTGFLYIVLLIILLFVLTAAMAAWISRRNAAIINAGARGGYPTAAAGNMQYTAVKTEHA